MLPWCSRFGVYLSTQSNTRGRGIPEESIIYNGLRVFIKYQSTLINCISQGLIILWSTVQVRAGPPINSRGYRRLLVAPWSFMAQFSVPCSLGAPHPINTRQQAQESLRNFAPKKNPTLGRAFAADLLNSNRQFAAALSAWGLRQQRVRRFWLNCCQFDCLLKRGNFLRMINCGVSKAKRCGPLTAPPRCLLSIKRPLLSTCPCCSFAFGLGVVAGSAQQPLVRLVIRAASP